MPIKPSTATVMLLAGVSVPLQAKDASKVLNWRVVDQSSKLVGTVQDVSVTTSSCRIQESLWKVVPMHHV